MFDRESLVDLRPLGSGDWALPPTFCTRAGFVAHVAQRKGTLYKRITPLLDQLVAHCLPELMGRFLAARSFPQCVALPGMVVWLTTVDDAPALVVATEADAVARYLVACHTDQHTFADQLSSSEVNPFVESTGCNGTPVPYTTITDARFVDSLAASCQMVATEGTTRINPAHVPHGYVYVTEDRPSGVTVWAYADHAAARHHFNTNLASHEAFMEGA